MRESITPNQWRKIEMLKHVEMPEAETLVHKNTGTAHRQLSHREYQHPVEKFPVTVLADDFDVPMNVGSVFRLCDALGVEKLYLTGASPLPSNRKVVKTSRSTEQYVDHIPTTCR